MTLVPGEAAGQGCLHSGRSGTEGGRWDDGPTAIRPCSRRQAVDTVTPHAGTEQYPEDHAGGRRPTA